MKILIVEDERVSRTLLTEMLSPYGVCHVAVDGLEALKVVREGFDQGERYDLICLDIVMPKMDGHAVLAEIRKMEKNEGIAGAERSKVMMTTILDDSKNIMKAFTKGECEAYLTKPISKMKLRNQLIDLGVIRN